jgi:hypothetical protein
MSSLVIETMKSDGTDVRQVTPDASYDFAITDTSPAWSPDGQKIAFASNRGCVTHCDGQDIFTINSDGTGGMAQLTHEGAVATDGDPAWSPSGLKIAFDHNASYPDLSAFEIDTMNSDGTGRVTVTQGTDPNWSPDGGRIAFAATLAHDGPFDLYVANADGSGRTNLTNSSANEGQPAWSPDGTKIAFVTDKDGNQEVYAMNSDGSGATNLSQNASLDEEPDWQPVSPTAPKHNTSTNVSCSPNPVFNGQTTTCTATVADTAASGKIAPAGTAAFTSDGAGSFSASSCTLSPSSASSASCQVTYTPSTIGSGFHKITASYAGDPTHNPSSGSVNLGVSSTTAYARPRGASPFLTYLVPAYTQCTAVNSTHGSPLAFPSCKPPQPASAYLTVGTPDANGAAPHSIGFIKLRVKTSSPEDLLISGTIFDVRCLPSEAASVCSSANSADGPDYSGELQANAVIRITDHYNGSSLHDPATVQDLPFPFNFTCSNTVDTGIGGTCTVNTASPVVCPECGLKEGQRTIVQLDQLQVRDGGPDGRVSTSAGYTVFMVEGIFVP